MIAVLIPILGSTTGEDDSRIAQARIEAKAVDWPDIDADTVQVVHTMRPAVDPTDDDLASHIRLMRTNTHSWGMLAIWPWWTETPHRRVVSFGARQVADATGPAVWPRKNHDNTVLILNLEAYDALLPDLKPSGPWWTTWHTHPDPWNTYAVRFGAPL